MKNARKPANDDGSRSNRHPGSFPPALGAAATALALAVIAPLPAAHAGPVRLSVDNATWRAECGGCHVPYPPSMLSARDWESVMAGLERHYGTDASIDAPVAAEISGFLARHAGRPRAGAHADGGVAASRAALTTAGATNAAAAGAAAGASPAPRITTAGWFRKEHREVPPTAWSNRTVKSAANCAACHPGAERGDFDEHAVRVPR